MRNNNNRFLWLTLAAIVVYTSASGSATSEPDEPTAAGLAVILDAFAYNVQRDGEQGSPVLQYSADVGAAFNEFGKRTAVGRSYKATFSPHFQALGLELKESLGVTDRPRSLSPASRSAAVAIFRKHARRIDGETP